MNSTTLTAQEIEDIVLAYRVGFLYQQSLQIFGGFISSPEQKNSKVQELFVWEWRKWRLLAGDNLAAIKWVKSDYTQPIKLIYIDPPLMSALTFTYPFDFQKGFPSRMLILILGVRVRTVSSICWRLYKGNGGFAG